MKTKNVEILQAYVNLLSDRLSSTNSILMKAMDVIPKDAHEVLLGILETITEENNSLIERVYEMD